ncbi:MAG: cytochrome c biogenesis protein CcdA [Candidatus Omnitrophota bacterium]
MEIPSLGLAFLAGVGYFFSPCTLPLLPSYLVYLSGISIPDITGKKRVTVFLNAGCFLAGFLSLFILLGASATMAGNFLGQHLKFIQNIGGAVIIFLGLLLIRKPGFLYRLPQRHSTRSVKPAGLLGSFLVGLSFSAAWTGCSIPVLATIMVTAAVSETVRQGILLLILFSAGMAIPFLFCAFLIDHLLVYIQKIQRHLHKIEIILGLFFIAFGIRLLFKSFPFHF